MENVMDRVLSLVGVLLLASMSALRGFAQDASIVEKAITDLESKWAAAQKVGQAEIVAPMLADRFITIGTDGKLATKDELLAHVKPGNWDDYGISDVKVIVYGQVAIATGLWTGKGQVGDHKVDIHERWTDTWVHMAGGTWQCVASQQTEIK
jgi:ketosteroid isomerase-like protein